MKLINGKEFAFTTLNLKDKIFVFYVVLKSLDQDIYPLCKTLLASFVNIAFIGAFSKYSNFTDGFFPDLIAKCFRYTRINDHPIDLVNNQ